MNVLPAGWPEESTEIEIAGHKVIHGYEEGEYVIMDLPTE